MRKRKKSHIWLQVQTQKKNLIFNLKSIALTFIKIRRYIQKMLNKFIDAVL